MTYDEASWVNVASDKTHLHVGGGSQMFVSHDGRTVYSYGGCEQPGHPAACNNQLLRFDTLGSRWAAVTIATEAIGEDPDFVAVIMVVSIASLLVPLSLVSSLILSLSQAR
jgi:hypothetical protein